MHNKKTIIPGLLIFLLFMTFPIWSNALKGDETEFPKLVKPKNATECVAETQYMRTSHMALLYEWRDDIVRYGGMRTGITAGGMKYDRTLHGCISCHGSAQNFCIECHNYVAVTVSCWDCHVSSEEVM